MRLVAEAEARPEPSTSSSQLPLVSRTAEVREEDLVLGPALPVMVNEEYSKNRLLRNPASNQGEHERRYAFGEFQ